MCSEDHITCSISIPGIFFLDMPPGGSFILSIGAILRLYGFAGYAL